MTYLRCAATQGGKGLGHALFVVAGHGLRRRERGVDRHDVLLGDGQLLILFVDIYRGGRRDQHVRLMRAHVIMVGQNRPCHLVQQRRGARLEVAVVVVQGNAALVGEADQDARPVHAPAVGTGCQPAQRLGWWFRGGGSGG